MKIPISKVNNYQDFRILAQCTRTHTHIQKVRQRMIEANQVKQDKNKRKQTNKQINEDSEEVLQIRTLCCSYETSKRNGNGIILQKLCVASLL